MHPSIILVSFLAALAAAGPLHKHAKRHLEITTATLTVTVWVTAGDLPSTTTSTTTSHAAAAVVTSDTSSTLTSTTSETTTSAPVNTAPAIVQSSGSDVTSATAANFVEYVQYKPAPSIPEPVIAAASPPPISPPVVDPPAAPAPPSPPASSSSGNSDIDSWTSVMNVARAKYQAGTVSWDASLAAKALTSAQTCVMEHTNSGQNIYETMGSFKMSEPSHQDVVDSWMSEETTFAANGCFGQPSATGKCWQDGNIEMGHFTQMVWKSATKFGCASFECPGAQSGYGAGGDKWITFCNWDAGNLMGSFDTNVLPPK